MGQQHDSGMSVIYTSATVCSPQSDKQSLGSEWISFSCNYTGESSSCTGCEARAPSPLGSGRWWVGQIGPALFISQPLIDMCSHCESPPVTYRVKADASCVNFHFHSPSNLLSPLYTGNKAKQQCSCISLCACVCPVGGEVKMMSKGL